MSTTFDRLQRAAAVLIAGGVLLWSAVASHDLKHLVPETTTKAQIQAVQEGQEILRGLHVPVADVQPCDAIKSLYPDHFDRSIGDTPIRGDWDKRVILCFRNSIDYGDALTAADKHGMFWTTGLGGDTIVAFAKDEATFLEVMNRNGVSFGPGDLHPWSLGLDGLRPENGAARKDDGNLVINPRVEKSEVLFGPYVNLSNGRHRLDIVFEPARPGDCYGLVREKVWIAVTYGSRTKALLQPTEVKLERQPGSCNHRLAVDFDLPPDGAEAVETPVWVQGLATMKIKSYQITPVPAAGEASKSRP